MKLVKAGGVIIDKDKVYLIKTEDELQFPKGYLDPGESIVEAADREVFEETGFTNIYRTIEEPIILNYNYLDVEQNIIHVELNIFIYKLNSQNQVHTMWMDLEHLEGAWYDIEAAIEKTNYPTVKDALKKLYAWIRQHN